MAPRPALLIRYLCDRSLDWAVGQGLLPSYERSGKYRPPAEPPHPLNFGKDTLVMAHYADRRGDLYADEDAWRRAYLFVDAFTQKSLANPHRRDWTLPRLFGSFGSLAPPAIQTQIETAMLRQGFVRLDGAGRGAEVAVFRLLDNTEISNLSEPYGKWLQARRHRLPWRDRIDLVTEVHVHAYAKPAMLAPHALRSYVDVALSAPALTLLPQLHRHLASTFRTPGLLDPVALPELERVMREGLRSLMAAWDATMGATA